MPLFRKTPIRKKKWTIDLKSFYPLQAKFNKSKEMFVVLQKNRKNELIGLGALWTNIENDRELGYWFRKKYWRKGYGTEIAKGIIDFGFNKLKLSKIIANVWIENKSSKKVLEKYLLLMKEFYNEREDCIDRRYVISKEDWKVKRVNLN